MVVIAEGLGSEDARERLRTRLSSDEAFVFVGEACPVGPAAKYETTEIHLRADGELAVTVPVAALR
jgi:hypothetical protein